CSASCSRGGTATPCWAICCSTRRMRCRTSLLVTGSELTNATMKSAVTGTLGVARSRLGWLGKRSDWALAWALQSSGAHKHQTARRESCGRRSVIVLEAAGRIDFFTQVFVARHLLLQGLKGIGADPGKTSELELEQDTLIGS